MSSTFKTNAASLALCAQRIQSLQTHIPADSTVDINGRSYKVSELVSIYQASFDSRTALLKSRAQVKADLLTRNGAEAAREAIEPGLKSWIIGKFGEASPTTTELGFAPRKRGAPSAETTANAVKLAKATREARHTVGKKVKLKIKGALPVPTPTDPASAGPSAPPAPPAKANGAQASPPTSTSLPS